MEIKGLMDEDIVNYKTCSMYIAFPNCTFKCEKECGRCLCQNSRLANEKNIEITPEEICERYLKNPLTKAIVCAGLEPFDSRFDLLVLVNCLRIKYECNDDIVIYTGYTEEEMETLEVQKFIYNNLKNYSNIIVKFGRFVPDEEPHYDEVLGVKLASSNQYGKKIT